MLYEIIGIMMSIVQVGLTYFSYYYKKMSIVGVLKILWAETVPTES